MKNTEMCLFSCTLTALKMILVIFSKGNRLFGPITCLCTAQPEPPGSFPSPISHYLVSFPASLIFSLLVRLAEHRRVDLLMHRSPGTTQKCVNVAGVCVLSKRQQERTTQRLEETRAGRKNTDKRLEICFALIA